MQIPNTKLERNNYNTQTLTLKLHT